MNRCAYCGQSEPLIWVHGHGQCRACKVNVEECCRGETGEHDTNRRQDSTKVDPRTPSDLHHRRAELGDFSTD